MDNTHKKLDDGMPKWLTAIFPLVSVVLGGTALWYTWLTYADIGNQVGFLWHEWIRSGFMLLMGIFCLVAALFYILGKPSAWSVFKIGLAMVPIMLFTNLVVLILRIIMNIFNGNVPAFITHIFGQQKSIIILLIVVAFILLGFLDEKDKKPE